MLKFNSTAATFQNGKLVTVKQQSQLNSIEYLRVVILSSAIVLYQFSLPLDSIPHNDIVHHHNK